MILAISCRHAIEPASSSSRRSAARCPMACSNRKASPSHDRRLPRGSPCALAEQPVTLLVDDLLRLDDAEGHGIVLAAVGVDPDEAVLLDAARKLLADHARGVPAG